MHPSQPPFTPTSPSPSRLAAARRLRAFQRLTGAAALLHPDELDVLVNIAEGAVHGASVYGPLTLESDQRSLPHEALAELRDATFYLASSLLRLVNHHTTSPDPEPPPDHA